MLFRITVKFSDSISFLVFISVQLQNCYENAIVRGLCPFVEWGERGKDQNTVKTNVSSMYEVLLIVFLSDKI